MKISRDNAREKANDLQNELADSVPFSDYMNLEHKLNLYIAKSKILMEREKSWIEFKDRREIEQFKEGESAKKVRELEIELQESKGLITKLEADIKVLANVSEAASIAAVAKSRCSKLEVQVQVLSKRAESAENLSKSLKDNEEDLKKRLENMENMYLESKEEAIKLEEDMAQLKINFEGGASQEDFKTECEKRKNLEGECQKLREDVIKCNTYFF